MSRTSKTNNTSSSFSITDSGLIIGIGLLQGLAIYALGNSPISGWVSENPWLLSSLWGLAIFLPPTAQWLIAHRRERGYWLMLLTVALAIPAVCWEPARGELNGRLQIWEGPLFLGGALAWLAAISLAGAALQKGGIQDYPNLFRIIIRSILLPLGAALFTGIFWLLLVLWGALFKLISIDFFHTLFSAQWFLLPLQGLVFGVATALLLGRPALIDGVRRAGTAIAAALLPVVVVIHLGFLGSLVVVGLEPLWATRQATALVLTLLMAFLLMVNGAHEEGTKLDCLPRFIAGPVRLAILLSPVYVAIAGYSLWLRVVQYGWSPDRVTSASIVAFSAILVLAYLATSVQWPFLTLPRLRLPNIAALWAVLAFGLAVNSPLLSPKRISAASQEQRILTGQSEPQQIDWYLLRFGLGHYGRDILDRLAVITDIPHDAEIREHAEGARAPPFEERYALRDNAALRYDPKFEVVPTTVALPDDLAEVLKSKLGWRLPSCDGTCRLLAIDLNKDDKPEFILLAGQLPVFYHHNGSWDYLGEIGATEALNTTNRAAILARLGKGSAKTVPSEWQDIEVNGVQLHLK